MLAGQRCSESWIYVGVVTVAGEMPATAVAVRVWERIRIFRKPTKKGVTYAYTPAVSSAPVRLYAVARQYVLPASNATRGWRRVALWQRGVETVFRQRRVSPCEMSEKLRARLPAPSPPYRGLS